MLLGSGEDNGAVIVLAEESTVCKQYADINKKMKKTLGLTPLQFADRSECLHFHGRHYALQQLF